MGGYKFCGCTQPGSCPSPSCAGSCPAHSNTPCILSLNVRSACRSLNRNTRITTSAHGSAGGVASGVFPGQGKHAETNLYAENDREGRYAKRAAAVRQEAGIPVGPVFGNLSGVLGPKRFGLRGGAENARGKRAP